MQPLNSETNKLGATMYKDRGIIKWAPFDALNGFHEMIAAYKYEKGKMARPVLLEDKLNDLDNLLKEVILESLEIEVHYFMDGYIKHMYGYIKKIDRNNRYFILDSGYRINLEDVVDIKRIPTPNL